MTGAGPLDRRVQFLRALLVDTGLGHEPVFDPWGEPVWASRKDVSDAERWRAAEVQAEVVTRFVIRWSTFAAGITPKDRLLTEGEVYEIAGVKQVGRRHLIEITCARRVDLGEPGFAEVILDGGGHDW